MLLRRLRALAKAYDRLARAVPNPKQAEVKADNALSAVLESLSDPDLGTALEELIPNARKHILEDPNAFLVEFENQGPQLLLLEKRLVESAGVKSKHMEIMRRQCRKNIGDAKEFVTTIASLKQELVQSHDQAKTEIAKSREIPRKEKKERKNNIAQGVTSAVFGTAVIATNAQLPVLFAFSYGLGGSALHQAMRDIVGSPV